MKYEIEIEDGLIPEGWEAIAYRVPRDSDHAVLSGGVVFLPRHGNAPEIAWVKTIPIRRSPG